MSVGPRSYDRFGAEDLAHLADIARRDLEAFIARNPHHQSLKDRILLVALCQGAAVHYLNGTNGVKDFDVWTFFADDGASPPYPARRRGVEPFEGTRFTSSTRRVDLLGRTLKAEAASDPIEIVRGYLRSASGSGWHLAQKAVVVLEPAERRGEVIWGGN